MATIAGIARAPSRYSPIRGRAHARPPRPGARSHGARRLPHRGGRHRWRTRPLVVREPPDVFRERSPYFAEHVRRDIAKRYGEKKLLEGGLEIETTLLPWIDASAQENVDFSLRKLDKRQGWRGPVGARRGRRGRRVTPPRRRALRQRGRRPRGASIWASSRGTADRRSARVRVGKRIYMLPPEGMSWAFPFSTRDSTNGKGAGDDGGRAPRRATSCGSRTRTARKLRRFSDWTYDEKSEVQWLAAYDETAASRRRAAQRQLQLEQTPRVQGAVFSYDHHTGYVVAMVGGLDHDRSEFNRVVAGLPAAGLDLQAHLLFAGPGSRLRLRVAAERHPARRGRSRSPARCGRPTNLNNTVEYQVTLEYALIWSKNVPRCSCSSWWAARRSRTGRVGWGSRRQIIPDQALALGASCTRIDELTRVVLGVRAQRLAGRSGLHAPGARSEGRVLEDHTAAGDPMGPPDLRLDRLVASAGRRPRPSSRRAPRG